MHKHNHDLIAALAEGVLAADLADQAEADILTCAECSADLADQRAALAALQAAPPAALTAVESSELREAVAGALRLPNPVPAPAAPARRPGRRAWVAIAAATGLAAMIAVVPVIGLITPSSDDAGDGAMTVAFEQPTDTAPAEESARNDLGADAQEGEMAVTEPAGAPPEEAPATTEPIAAAEAPATTAAPATTLEETLGLKVLAGESAIRELFAAGPVDEYDYSTDAAERSAAACGAEAEQQLGNEVVLVQAPASLDDGRPVVLYATADWSMLVAFDLDGCTAAFTLP